MIPGGADMLAVLALTCATVCHYWKRRCPPPPPGQTAPSWLDWTGRIRSFATGSSTRFGTPTEPQAQGWPHILAEQRHANLGADGVREDAGRVSCVH